MKSIQGPAIFLAQFAGDEAPFNSLENISKWASDLGYKGVQIPSWDGRLFDLTKASESKDYCDEVKGILKSYNLSLTELSTHLQGQLVAVHPADRQHRRERVPLGRDGPHLDLHFRHRHGRRILCLGAALGAPLYRNATAAPSASRSSPSRPSSASSQSLMWSSSLDTSSNSTRSYCSFSSSSKFNE